MTYAQSLADFRRADRAAATPVASYDPDKDVFTIGWSLIEQVRFDRIRREARADWTRSMRASVAL